MSDVTTDVDEPEYDPFADFDASAGIGEVRDPYPVFHELRSRCPVHVGTYHEEMGIEPGIEAAMVGDGDPAHRAVVRDSAAGAQGRRDVLVVGLRRQHGAGVRALDPRDGRARAPPVPLAHPAGLHAQGDGALGSRPRTSDRQRAGRQLRRPRQRRARARALLPVPGQRDRGDARPAGGRSPDVPREGRRADLDRDRHRPWPSRVAVAVRLLRRDHRRAAQGSARRSHQRPRAGGARRREPHRRRDHRVPPAAAPGRAPRRPTGRRAT